MYKTALILGTGWNHIVNHVKKERSVSFEKYFGRKAGVSGHKGEVVFGTLSGKQVMCIAGRFHTYEGYSSYDTTITVRKAKEEGADTIILTSAAGALNKTYRVGDMVVLSDTLNLFLKSPLTGAKFQDMSSPFDQRLRKTTVNICKQNKIPFQQGVCVYVRGPHFESFTDKRALAALGADVVGMSMCAEVIMAKYLGMKVLGLSCVTNLAFVKHSHKEVLETSEKASGRMITLLKQVVGSL